MMMDYGSVVSLLSDVQNENKANSVFDEVKERSEDPHFVTLLQHAIRDHQLQNHIRLAGVIVLCRVLSEKSTEWELEFQINCLIAVIGDPSVQYCFKESLETNLTQALEFSPFYIFEELLRKVIADLLLLPKNQQQMQIQESTLEKVPENLKTSLLYLRCLLNSQVHFGLLSSAIKETLLQNTINIKIIIGTAGTNALISLAEFWKSVIEVARGQISADHTDLLKWLARNQILTEWVFQLYGVDRIEGQFLFINIQSQLDHEHINELKTAAANLHSTILSAMDQSRQNEVQQLIGRHLSQVPLITNTILTFSSHTARCNKYQPFVTSLLGVLILQVKMNPPYFGTICDQLLHIIVFPLLAANEEEHQLFADDPEEFNSLAEDCCDRQAYGILKTQASRLLQSFCDEIRGPSQYAIQHAIISIKVRLSLCNNISPQSINNFLPLEEALFILAILSYRLSKHTKELNELRVCLKVSSIVDKVSPLELARFFQFFAYNYQQLYPSVAQGEEWIYLALKTSIQQSVRHPTLAYAALDFMSNVIQNYFSQPFALSYMQKCTCDSALQFKIFLKIISKHFAQFSEKGLCQALQSLLQAVLGDMQKYQKGEKKHTMDISHSLQAVRRIAEKHNFLQDKKELKSVIWGYTRHLQKFYKIGTDDEIVKLVTSFVKIEGITQPISEIYHTILEFYIVQNFIQTPYIVFMNEMAIKSNDPLSFGIIEPIFRAAEQLHFSLESNPTSVTDNLALANTLIVLQNIIAYFGDKLRRQTVAEIADLACKIIPVSDQPQNRIEPIILARALNLLFLCHMHFKDERALKKMLLFQDIFLFRGHDLKVLTACLVKELFRQSDIVAVTEMINLLITHIWKTNSEYTPEVRSKKNPSIKMKSTVVRIKKIADFELGLKLMTNPFSSQECPEQQLREAIDKMKSMNSLLFQGIIRSLPSTKGDHLRSMMSEVTIQGQKRKIIKAGELKVSHDEDFKRFPPKKRTYQPSDNQEQLEGEEEESPTRKKEAKKKRKEEIAHRD